MLPVPQWPSPYIVECLGGGFPLSQLSLSTDNLRLITFSQGGRCLSCPTASLWWYVAGTHRRGSSLLRDFRSQKWEVVCWSMWQSTQNFTHLLHYHGQCSSLANTNLNWMACRCPAHSQAQLHSKNFSPSTHKKSCGQWCRHKLSRLVL